MTIDMRGTVELARWWWTFILRGALAMAFGVVAFLAPTIGLAALIGLFAAWALIDGVTGLAAGISARATDRTWWLTALEGAAGVLAGILALLFPDLAAATLVLLLAAWAIVTGIIEIVAAVRLRRQIRGEQWLGLAGLASILLGVVMVLYPGAAVLTVVWLIGGMALAFGAFLLLLGWRLRRIDALAKLDAAHDHGR
ncbi:MAG TPA: DUF308 domain-containing protein [Candidatus Limnocylindria bacterium]|nr:DUF308 domain-containing protein [Candidatus Limnocylindria bacterium]